MNEKQYELFPESDFDKFRRWRARVIGALLCLFVVIALFG